MDDKPSKPLDIMAVLASQVPPEKSARELSDSTNGEVRAFKSLAWAPAYKKATEGLAARYNPQTGKLEKIKPPAGKLGRPAEEMARYIMDRTGDGQELIDFALGVLRGDISTPELRTDPITGETVVLRSGGPSVTMDQRIEIMKWLTDRGAGKAPVLVDVNQRLSSAVQVDLSPLRPEELVAFYRMQSKLVTLALPPLPSAPETSNVVEGEFKEVKNAED